MRARILWVEGKRTDNSSFVPSLRKKEYWVEVAPTGSVAVARLVEVDPDLVVVNAASLRSSGKRICNEIRERSSELPIVLIVSYSSCPLGIQYSSVPPAPFLWHRTGERHGGIGTFVTIAECSCHCDMFFGVFVFQWTLFRTCDHFFSRSPASGRLT